MPRAKAAARAFLFINDGIESVLEPDCLEELPAGEGVFRSEKGMSHVFSTVRRSAPPSHPSAGALNVSTPG